MRRPSDVFCADIGAVLALRDDAHTLVARSAVRRVSMAIELRTESKGHCSLANLKMFGRSMKLSRQGRDAARIRAALGLAFAMTAFACGCGSSTGEGRAELARGRLHYLSTCSRCHQPDGQGFAQVYPNLDGNPIVQGEDPSAVIDIVLHGRADMPSFASHPPDELAEIITYVRHAWGNGASAVSPSQVK